MQESLENQETIDTDQLLSDIKVLREFAITSNERNDLFIDMSSQWDKIFKEKLREKYGTTRFAQQVPVWQAMVGGTVEEETDITDEIRNFIVFEVNTFYKKVERELESA